MPAVFRHDALFVLRHMHRAMGHTFRGSSWRSMLGLESARAVFARYKTLRAQEREMLDWPDPPVNDQPATKTVPASPLRLLAHDDVVAST